MASSTEPEIMDSRMKERMPNLGCSNFPVRERPPSGNGKVRSGQSYRRELYHTNKTFEVVTFTE